MQRPASSHLWCDVHLAPGNGSRSRARIESPDPGIEISSFVGFGQADFSTQIDRRCSTHSLALAIQSSETHS